MHKFPPGDSLGPMDIEFGIAMIFVGLGLVTGGFMLTQVQTGCPPAVNFPGCSLHPWVANGVAWVMVVFGLFVTAGGTVPFWSRKPE